MDIYYYFYIIALSAGLFAHITRISNISNLNEAFTHPGTILLGFFYLYCIIPVLFFITQTVEGAPVSWGIYSDYEIKAHLNRSLIFGCALLLSIHVFYKNKPKLNRNIFINFDFKVVSLCLSVFFIVNIILILLSAPVDSYYDFYTRFDHLDGVPAYISVICKRLSWGLTPITLFVLSVYFRENFKLYLISISIIIIFIIINSYGSRIDAILAILQAITYRMLWRQKSISKFQILISIPLIGLAIYALRSIELIRLGIENNSSITFETVILAAPGEFFALLFPSIDLYRILSDQNLPSAIYYFKDIFNVVPFFDSTELDLMHWYWKNFAPEAPVAPYTMGVLAEPALFGSWWLVVQALVIGGLTIFINNLRFANDPYRLVAFGYLTSTGVLVLKYNMLTYVDLFFNNFIPGAAVFWVIMRITKSQPYPKTQSKK